MATARQVSTPTIRNYQLPDGGFKTLAYKIGSIEHDRSPVQFSKTID